MCMFFHYESTGKYYPPTGGQCVNFNSIYDDDNRGKIYIHRIVVYYYFYLFILDQLQENCRL